MKGKITKTLVDNGDSRHIRIELQDDNGLLVTRINMSVEDFGYLMGGVGHNKCEYDVYDNYHLLGKTRETKTELIETNEIPYESDKFKAMMLELVKPYEVDGWKANPQDIKSWNHHNATRDNKYKVSFSRYV